MVHTNKHSLYYPFIKKGIYFGDQASLLGFKYELEVTAFLELQGEAKKGFTDLANLYKTTSQLLNLLFLTHMRFYCWLMQP